MAGEMQQTYAISELESKQQDKETAQETFGEKALKESSEHFQHGSLEAQAVNNGTKLVEKERDNVQQREAVIRPQQAGKIDFKSLQSHPKFTSDRSWPSGKSSPQSPTGKGRNRDKGKKSGKAERGNPQQLYRLSITNPRSNPTIGIAYPQQKVSPPKKLEASRGPVSGSYRFRVPSIPEREAELQQEELNYNRCFQDGSANLTSPSYTSQMGSAGESTAHQHVPSTPQQQPSGLLENSSTQPSNHIVFPDFQLSGADVWQSPERTFGSGNYGISVQKPNTLVELNKTNGSFMPVPFQCGYPILEDSTTDTFTCDQPPQSQDYADSSLAPNQATQSTFSFQSSEEGHDAMQNSTQLNKEQKEERPSYPLQSKQPQYLQAPNGVQSSMHCSRNISEDTGNGEGSLASLHQSEQNKSVATEKSDTYCQVDNRDAVLNAGNKRGCHPKNGTASQRVLIQGSVQHIRNISQNQSSQMHFSNKVYSSPPLSTIHMGPVSHEKSLNKSRVTQSWEGPNKAFPSTMDQNSTPYSNVSEKYPFQCQPVQNTGNSSRMPWQQIRLTPAMPSQNRIELTKQLSNQQLTFLLAQSEWQEDGKSHKSSSLKGSNTFPSKRPGESFSNPRQDTGKHSCTTIPACQYNSKVEAGHGQVSDSKNKSVYFGMNQSVPGAPSRTCSYTPLQVPPMGLMLVSPYESPLPSPIQNPASSSTCSSLSPASTSPANSSSDDNQISKTGPPSLQFYHQHQGKTLTSSDHLTSNLHHFHTEASCNLHYTQERTKEDILNFLQNNRQPKSDTDNGKGCMDSFGMEHHPPPPYSAHQLLATSLAAANLDQLDVLLTCKQCDQNFNNLASFLDHKQYCLQQTFAQNDFKHVPKAEDNRKYQTDPTKVTTSGSNYSMSRCSSDLHLSLLGLTKNGELMSDSEIKGESKDDPLKINLYTGVNNTSTSLPELEMEDAKLDSLITEALNGLGYQSDNAEIDSSFIDAFVDDDLTTTKCTSSRQNLKSKDSMFDGRSKHEGVSSERSQTQGNFSFDSDFESSSTDRKHTDSLHKNSLYNSEQYEDTFKEETDRPARESSEKTSSQNEWVREKKKSEKATEENDCSPRFLLTKKFSERCGIKSSQSNLLTVKSTLPELTSASRSSTTQRIIARESKRKRTSGGSWSKELIHKIVQQKNKLHKLHVKGTKNMQFSLVMERLTPTVQNPTFREYDYVSDSDEDCEPVKIASQGRLSQSIRCKYTYTKECKERVRGDRNRDSPWKQDRNECFETKTEATSSPQMKESSCHQRLRRRSSRSSSSSELSTSLSISSDSSPKSADRTDSDSEKKVEIRRKDSDSSEQNEYERSPQRIRKESTTALALSFSKNTKRYSADKILLSEHKYSYSTSKCSKINIKTEKTTKEHTTTAVSLAMSKTTRVPQDEKDHLGCDKNTGANIDEPVSYKKEIQKDNTFLKGTDSSSYLVEARSRKESSRCSKLKKDVISNVNRLHKRGNERGCPASHLDSDSSSGDFDKFSDSASSIKETKSSSSDLLTQSPALCSSIMDEVCLSPTNLHDSTTQKERQCLMPYPLEQDQNLIKSPLSFDTSSMFGDLTVGGFDNNLYSDIQLNKESFSPLEATSDKKELFESSFSPFLEQRDWGLMVDVSPVLPDDISQYKDDSDIVNEKKTNFNHVPFTLPEKIMDYNANTNSCVSEDELEIKRIVTELESQLQTAKLSNSPLLDNELPKQLTMSKFSPLRLGHESENEQSNIDVDCASESLALAAPSLPTDSQSEIFSEPELPWSSPLQFGMMGRQQCLHTPTHSDASAQDSLGVKEDSEHTGSATAKHQTTMQSSKTENKDNIKNPDTNKSEEMVENEIYAENLMKSLEVISDSIFKKSLLTSELPESIHSKPSKSEVPQIEYKGNEKEQKQDKNKVASTDASQNTETRICEEQVSCLKSTDHSSDTKEEPNNNPGESITSKIRSPDLNNISDTEKNESHSEAIPFGKDLRESNIELMEDTCESHSPNKLETQVSPELKIKLDIEHKNEPNICKTSVCQEKQGEPGLDLKLETNLDSKEIPQDPKESHVSPFFGELKGESAVSKGEESSQAILTAKELHHDPNLKESSQKQETASSLVTGEDFVSHSPRYSYSEGPCGEETLPSHSEHSYIHAVTPNQLEINQKDHVFRNTLDQYNSDTNESVTRRGNTQESHGKSSSMEYMPPMITSLSSSVHEYVKRSAMQSNQSPSSDGWKNTDVPALTQEVQPVRRISSDNLTVSKTSDNCSSFIASEINQTSVPHLNLEINEAKVSSPGTLLAMNTISGNLPFSETTEHCETLKAPPAKEMLYEFKLSPKHFSEISDDPHFSDKHLDSATSINGIAEECNIKSSPKHDLSSCALALNMTLSSSGTLNPANAGTEIKSTNPDNSGRLTLRDLSLEDSHCQNNVKCPCLSLNCSHYKEEVSAANTGQLSKSQSNLETSHAPLETIDYMDLQINFLKKDVGNADSQVSSCEDHHLSFNKSMSEDQETIKAQLVSANELPDVPIKCASFSLSKGEQYTKQPELRASPRKGGAQHAAPGKFQCEICSMYFRTVPGLKRHKALKHLAKADGISTVENLSVNNQGNVSIYPGSYCLDKDLEKKRELDPIILLKTARDCMSVGKGEHGETALMFEGMASDCGLSKSTEGKDKEKGLIATEKTKKVSKARKNKKTDLNNGCLAAKLVKSDPFPDELLSILKTDILQAISPDFPSMVQQESSKPSEKQEAIAGNSEHKGNVAFDKGDSVKKAKGFHQSEISDIGGPNDAIYEKYEVAKNCLDMKKTGETHTIVDQEKNNAEQLRNAGVEIKYENNNYPSAIIEPLTHCFKDPPLSPSGLGTDLKALLDDENTFSQLFPRNEEMKRKKCTRVYGKCNRKNKPEPTIPVVPDYPGSHIFLDKNEEYEENKRDHMLMNSMNGHCQFETVSIDDAIMLDMCQKNTLKSSVEKICQVNDGMTGNQGNSCEETDEIGIRNFLHQNEDTLRRPSVTLDGSNILTSIAIESSMPPKAQRDTKVEVPEAPCPLQLVTSCVPYTGTTCVQDKASHFPTIDIQNLNATFQLPEIQFFEPGKDISLVGAIVPKDAEIRDSAESCKKPTERKVKKRMETSLKPKDKQYKCKVCFTWFLTLGELDFHKLSHNPSPPPTCYMCVQRKFSSREQLRDHLREKHAKNKAVVWTCGMCLKEISDVWMYNEHLREHATQFARKGQSQSSLLDMPGCFMQENAVKNFITSIMQHRPSKSVKGETPKSSFKDERKTSLDGTVQEPKTEGQERTIVKTKVSTGGSKHGAFMPLEVLHKVETAPKNAEMHPNCKDPSRDCHHCGKQFPKPFKLQRHLVVHSLQKIFLCHKCPVSYQEAKELRDHLKNEHEEVDEPDSKHTTLYTCELCADVMHVIKKSFICSTCNYTFSKKEQFDRHMEKHLSGGNKIFKFRGVLRPCKPSSSKNDEFDIPPNKKRKILTENLQENSSDSGIASIASLHLNQSADSQGLKSILPNLGDQSHNSVDEPSNETNNASVKIEDVTEDLSNILEELEQCQLQINTAEQTCVANNVPKAESSIGSPLHELPERDTKEVGTDNSKTLTVVCHVKEEDDTLCDATQAMPSVSSPKESTATEDKMKDHTFQDYSEKSFADTDEKMETEASDLYNMQINNTDENMNNSDPQDILLGDNPHLSKQQLSPNVTMQFEQEQVGEDSTTINSIEKEQDLQLTSFAELTPSGLDKDEFLPKLEETNKQAVGFNPKPGCTGPMETAPLPISSIQSEDKESMKQQKKRKDLKSPHNLQRVATRENLGCDARVKKKFRSSKCESITGQRKADNSSDYSVLVSVKDDTASNKIVPKNKAGALGLQPKRVSLDNCPPKKADIARHLHGDCKVKKGGKPIHAPNSKVSVSSMNNSFNKPRPKSVIKSVETHSFRTAESQNNLLSQLFGQRLTSFKIPLRKDTSESIN